MFRAYQLVTHLKTGAVYQILKTPNNRSVLEYCNEPYYEYVDIRYFTDYSEGKYMKWIRRQSEMEDGRFK